MARGQNEVTEQPVLCNWATQVSGTAHAEWRNNNDVKAGYVRKVQQVELKETRDRFQWYLPHHPVINPHKLEKIRRVCNAAAKFQSVALNDKLLIGPDLLQDLIGIIFRSREQQIALSADIEAMFLQVAVPSDDSRCLRSLWEEDPEQRMEVYEYTRHVLGGEKLSGLCKLRFASSGER